MQCMVLHTEILGGHADCRGGSRLTVVVVVSWGGGGGGGGGRGVDSHFRSWGGGGGGGGGREGG